MNIFLIVLATILLVLYGILRYKYSYWQLKGVKSLKTHFLFGNISHFRTFHFTECLQEIYDEFKGKALLAGTYMYTAPLAIILDMDLAKMILVRDFNKFVNRIDYENETNDPLTMNLFNATGEKWRALRSKLTSTFTSGKMKFMFPTVVDVANEFKDVFAQNLAKSSDANVEIYDLMGRYTTDVIGSCVFGIQCNSLKDPDVIFRRMGKKIFSLSDSPIWWRLFLRAYKNYLKFVGVKRFPKDVDSFIMDVVKDTVKTREKLNIHRNDFIDLLIELKNQKDANGEPTLNLSQMAAQVFIFFAAGFETSSSNMTYAIYEMAKQPDIQEKVRHEVLDVLEKYDGELTYDGLMEMNFLDQIISETLRLYPALSGLTRICVADFQIPGTDITIEKGTEVVIPAYCYQNDPDIYDEPQEFRPERFEPSEVQKRHPMSFLGFGDGPRNCIGLRFGRMQVKIGLATLLKSFRFSVSEKTPGKIKFSNRAAVLIPDCKVWLNVEQL